jgi:hypothetical protein
MPEKSIKRHEPQKWHSGFIEGGTPDDQKKAPKWLKEINCAFEDLAGLSLDSLNDSGIAMSHRSFSFTPFTFDEIAEQLELAYIHGAYDD